MSLRWKTSRRALDRTVVVDGANLRETREKANVTLEATADYLGLEPHVLAGLEKGHRTLSPAQAVALMSKLSKMTARAQPPRAARVPVPELEAAK